MKKWYLELPNAWRAAFNSAWQAAVAAIGLQLIGFLAQVQEWWGDTSRDFPSVSPLGKALSGILVGLVTAVVTVIFRGLKPGPQYTVDKTITTGSGEVLDVVQRDKDRGVEPIWIIVAVLIAIVCIILIVQNVNVEDDGALRAVLAR